jgi:Xaa-Pro aminopeptidase
MSIHVTRRERLLAQIRNDQLDGVLITNPVNVTYLTGFSGEASPLIVSRDKTILVSDGRFPTQIAEECPDLETYIRPPVQTLPEATAQTLNALGISKIGCESSHLTLAEFGAISEKTPTIDWQKSSDRVERLRLTKDETELAQIKEAIRIAERAFAMFRAMLTPEDSEKELADAMEAYVRRAGGKATAFSTIVAVGPRGALPHAPPTSMRVREAPSLLIDWGANGPFYKSDLTRVLFTHGGKANDLDPKLRQMHAAARRAQLAAIGALRPGAEAHEVDAAARKSLEADGFLQFFNHGLGHGFGLQIHEAPFMRPGNSMKIQAGMVVTIEPGIYLPGYAGVRLEDDVLVTEDGPIVLTSVPREIEECLVW